MFGPILISISARKFVGGVLRVKSARKFARVNISAIINSSDIILIILNILIILIILRVWIIDTGIKSPRIRIIDAVDIIDKIISLGIINQSS